MGRSSRFRLFFVLPFFTLLTTGLETTACRADGVDPAAANADAPSLEQDRFLEQNRPAFARASRAPRSRTDEDLIVLGVPCPQALIITVGAGPDRDVAPSRVVYGASSCRID